MNQFHLLRPEWLLALIPLLLLLWRMQSGRARAGNLATVCDPQLLPYLLISAKEKPAINLNLLIGIGGLLAIVALAGPSWKKLEQPVYRQQSSLVILLDLSSSMNGTDIEPSRLTKARFKLLDILKRRNEGQTALVVYAAQPFVVTPLTDDSATIRSLVNSLTTEIMPSQGSRPDLALLRGIELLKQSGATAGDLLFLTDGISDEALGRLLESHPKQYPASVLGIGTAEGGPIPLESGGFVQDRNGDIVVDKLDEQRLIKLAALTGGAYHRLTHDDRDIDYLLAAMKTGNSAENAAETTLTSDIWHEEGPWLILPLLPLAALAFRRGYLVILLLILPLPQPAHALEWSDLWLRPDQQAARTLAEGNPEAAARQFEDAGWRSAAHYQAGDYQQSLDALNAIDSADSNYNRGNALARLGRLQEAVEAYQKSLSQRPGDKDAEYNLELVKKLLQQQQQQNQSNQDDGQAKNDKSDTSQQQGGERNREADQKAEQDQPASNGDASSEPQRNQDQPNQDASAERDPRQQAEERTADDQSANEQSETDDGKTEEESQTLAGNDAEDQAKEREEESTRQWLRRIPDDPGGLLKRKFYYQYQQQFQGRAESEPW